MAFVDDESSEKLAFVQVLQQLSQLILHAREMKVNVGQRLEHRAHAFRYFLRSDVDNLQSWRVLVEFSIDFVGFSLGHVAGERSTENTQRGELLFLIEDERTQR